LRKPALLFARPEQLKQKRAPILTLARATRCPLSFEAILAKNPVVLTFSHTYLEARTALANRHPGRWRFFRLLAIPTRELAALDADGRAE
jgi:hypothetical protein